MKNYQLYVCRSNKLKKNYYDYPSEVTMMKKYFVIYYAPDEAVESMSGASPEEVQEDMKPWMAWAERSGSKLLDMGTPLGNGQNVSKSGSTPSTKSVTGYSILQAENIDEAKELLKGHPHLDYGEGCEIEVYESLPLPGS
jgi:hypothetical protein